MSWVTATISFLKQECAPWSYLVTPLKISSRCVCVCLRESVSECLRERVCDCVWERESVCEYERESVRVCVCESERVRVCVCVRERVGVSERGSVSVCVWERKRESERERERECMNVCVCESLSVYGGIFLINLSETVRYLKKSKSYEWRGGQIFRHASASETCWHTLKPR
jgi:hypothetical protein